MNLVDDMPLEDAVLFAEVDALLPGVVDFDWATAIQMPDSWLLGGETPLRAQVRLLSGRPDVTAWTAEAGRKLADVLKQPPTLHRTLLGLNVDDLPPAVTVAVSAEGDEGPPNL